MKKIILFFLLANLFLMPAVSLAGTYILNGQTVNYDGIVPCGKSTQGTGESSQVMMPCQFCHFFVMIKGIYDFVLKVVAVVAGLMFMIGGFFLITAGGSPTRTASGQRILTATAIGLAIFFGAWIIISTIFSFPGFINPNFGNGWDLTQWFEVSCTFSAP